MGKSYLNESTKYFLSINLKMTTVQMTILYTLWFTQLLNDSLELKLNAIQFVSH